MKFLFIGKDKDAYEVLNEVASLSQSEVIMTESLQKAKNIIETSKDIHRIIAFAKVDNLPTVQLLSILKRNEDLKDIPFIILAEDLTEDDKDYYKALGVTEVFEIPFNPLEVFLVITSSLKNTKGEELVKQILHKSKKDKSIFRKNISTYQKVIWN
jgi:DNA-binding response OmpR family regulator